MSSNTPANVISCDLNGQELHIEDREVSEPVQKDMLPSTSVKDIIDAFTPSAREISKRFKNMLIVKLSFASSTRNLKKYGNIYYLNLVDSQGYKFTAVCPTNVFDKSRDDYEISDKTSINIGIEDIKFDKSGKLSIIINSVAKNGVSLREATKLKIIKYCKAQGYYNREKKTLPMFISKVALITTSSGNTESDIQNQIGLNSSNVDLFKCRTDERDIAKTLRDVVQCGEYQIAVLFRGGNEDEYMLKYSAECVLDEVVRSPIVVASAIGHEADHSIVDDIVDVMFSTPSSFAKAILEHNNKFHMNIQIVSEKMNKSVQEYLKSKHLHVKNLFLAVNNEIVSYFREDWKKRKSISSAIKKEVIFSLEQAQSKTKMIQDVIDADIKEAQAAIQHSTQRKNIVVLAVVVVALIGIVAKLLLG